MEKYAIKIDRLNRYVRWCEDRWYETSPVPLYLYTREEAVKICDHLKYHCYQPKTHIIDESGKPLSVKKERNTQVKVKKSLFTINKTLLRK